MQTGDEGGTRLCWKAGGLLHRLQLDFRYLRCGEVGDAVVENVGIPRSLAHSIPSTSAASTCGPSGLPTNLANTAAPFVIACTGRLLVSIT